MRTTSVLSLLKTTPCMSFCTQTKTYRMPERKKLDLYKTEFPLRLHNYKILLYANKQGLATPLKLQLPFAASFFGIMYMMRHNPWYLTFPASLPIMLGLQIIIFIRWLSHKRHYKYIVERVYLNMDNSVELVFSNKVRRKLKDIEDSHTFSSPTQLITPPTYGKTGQFEWSQKGAKFPTELSFFKQENGQLAYHPLPSPLYYAWTKVCSNYENYIFPKNYEYANWEILVPLMNGRFIDFQNSTNSIHELQIGHQNHHLDVQLQWIKKDAEQDQKLKKMRLQTPEK